MTDTVHLDGAHLIRAGCTEPGCECGNTPHFMAQFTFRIDLELAPKEGEEGNPQEIARVYDLIASELASHATALRDGKMAAQFTKISL